MKRALAWLGAGVAACTLTLFAPLAYVETACRPQGDPGTYKSALPEAKHRDEGRTLMTYPEWAIVHAYDEYAEVIDKGDPHDFDYLAAISRFWGSLCELSQASGPHGGFSGDTKTTIYTIGVSFTAEMLAKALYEETLGRIATLVRGDGPSDLDDLSAGQSEAYATFLQQVPWYQWDFERSSEEISQAAGDTFRDHERRFALGIEYGVKAAYARVIKAAVGTMEPDALRLNMIVSGLESGALEAYPEVTVIGTIGQGIEIETPRYRKLTHLLMEIAKDGADFEDIAGNDDILLTVLSDHEEVKGAMHSLRRQGYGDTRHLMLVRVRDLAETLKTIDEDARLRLEHIYDY